MMDFGWIVTPSGWLSLATLSAMEIVLGIDNVIFLSLLSSSLPVTQARFARLFGLTLALVFRIACLAGLTWLIALTKPVVTVMGHDLSWRAIVLMLAGVFLIGQATLELHAEIDDDDEPDLDRKPRALWLVVVNIAAMDLVFSFDSILTAIGIARELSVMVIAICVSMVVMFAAATAVARFIHAHPTTKVLALCFLVLIGLSLVAEGTGFAFPRGYLYFAMVFSSGVELLNLLSRRNRRKRRVAVASEAEPSRTAALDRERGHPVSLPVGNDSIRD